MLALSLSPPPSQARNSLPDAAVDTLLEYTDVRESHGYNRSPEIDRFNRIAGARMGDSWCESAQYSAYELAARALGVKNPLMRTPSVSQQLRYAKMVGSGLEVIPISRLIGVSSVKVMRGDCLMARRGGGTDRHIGQLWPGHAGTAISQHERNIRSIEGNTSPGNRGSQRDGDGMHIRTRPASFWLAIVRVPKRQRWSIVWPVRLRHSDHRYA